jgi:Integrase core domain
MALRESMKEADIEMILERAKEKYPEARPRIISDKGPQFIARDFKEFIRISGMTHVRTSPFYPQSNGKIERWHKSLKRECIRPLTPLTLDDARRLIQIYVDHYNTVRLHQSQLFSDPRGNVAGDSDRELCLVPLGRSPMGLQSVHLARPGVAPSRHDGQRESDRFRWRASDGCANDIKVVGSLG